MTTQDSGPHRCPSCDTEIFFMLTTRHGRLPYEFKSEHEHTAERCLMAQRDMWKQRIAWVINEVVTHDKYGTLQFCMANECAGCKDVNSVPCEPMCRDLAHQLARQERDARSRIVDLCEESYLEGIRLGASACRENLAIDFQLAWEASHAKRKLNNRMKP